MSLKNSNFEIIYVMGQTYTHFKVLFSLIKTMPSFWKSVKNWLKYGPLKFSNGKLQRAISQSIFDRFLKTWHRFNQGKEFFKMIIGLVYYTFYFKIWVFKANNLSRFTRTSTNMSQGSKNIFKSLENQCRYMVNCHLRNHFY